MSRGADLRPSLKLGTGAHVLPVIEAMEGANQNAVTVAHHEAAHAVVALVDGAAVEYISLEPDGHTQAHVMVVGAKTIRYVIAGPLAGAFIHRDPDLAAFVACEAFSTRCASGDVVVTSDASRIIGCWARESATPERMASDLRAAVALVCEHWGGIEAVAVALLQRGTLTGSEVSALATAPPRHAAPDRRRMTSVAHEVVPGAMAAALVALRAAGGLALAPGHTSIDVIAIPDGFEIVTVAP